MVRFMLAVAALAWLLTACEDTGARVDKPTPTSLSHAHTEPANFNDIVLTGGRRSAGAGFSGTYTLRATIDGKAIDGVVTWHRKATKMRADFLGAVAGRQQDVIVFAGPGYPGDRMLSECSRANQSCNSVQLGPTGTTPSDEVLPSTLAFDLLDVATFASGLNFYDEAARTLVQQPALCFVGRSETVPVGAIDHGEVCLTDSGLPLLVTASGVGRTVSLTATKVPGGVKDNDFKLPYAVARSQ